MERGGYDPGTPDELARPGYGVRPEFDADFAFQFGMSKPMLAAINGPAAGVGFVIACYADLRFAVPGAVADHGPRPLNLPAEYGLSWLLPRLIGLTRANDLLLSSRVFLSDEAMELGLLNGLLPQGELLPEVVRRRPGAGRHGLAGLAARDQAPDLRRPPRRRRVVGAEGRRAPRPHDGRGGLSRGDLRVQREATAAVVRWLADCRRMWTNSAARRITASLKAMHSA